MTASDVAKAAGISRSAVSRAFTDGASVSDDTRRRAVEAAEHLGYRPNAIARMLIQQRSDLIGVVLGSLTNQFLSTLSASLLQALHQAGLRPLLFQASTRDELDQRLLTVLQYQVAAIVVTGFTPHPDTARRCAEAGAPVVVVNRSVPPGYPGVSVATDNYAGGRLAAEVLFQAGYRRIAMAIGDETMSTHRARRQGFTERLEELLHSPAGVESASFTHAGGFELGLRITEGPKPDAIFCSGDLLAFGVLDALRSERRMDIPGDIGVLGFDDVPMAAWPGYNLSTIRQPVGDIVSEVVGVLGRTRARPLVGSTSILLPPAFVQRGTTRSASDDAMVGTAMSPSR